MSTFDEYERGKRCAARRYLIAYGDDARTLARQAWVRGDRERRAYWLGVSRAMRAVR